MADYQFPIRDSSGNVTSTIVNMKDMFVPKSMFDDGNLYAWGSNTYGNIGNGTTTNYSSPVQVGTLTNWKQVACGSFSISISIKTDGTLWACGRNVFGELGNGTTTSYSSPIQVGSLTNWKQVAVKGHTAAIKTDGTLWTWGRNDYGQMGNGNRTSYSSPIQVGPLTNWKQVACGYVHTAAITTDGTLWTWGYNSSGQLGNNTASTTVYYSSPIQVGSLTNWKQVAAGHDHTAAITTNGTLWTWGRNNYGQLGNNTINYFSSPIQVGTLTNWKQVACGDNFTASIKTDGTLWACGYNGLGSLGNGNVTNYSSPIQVGSLTNWKQVAGGNAYTAAIKTDGTLWTWGYNSSGQLGYGTFTTNYSSPVQVGTLTNWKQVACGDTSTASITINNNY